MRDCFALSGMERELPSLPAGAARVVSDHAERQRGA
jgi:hypothetical protein